MLDSYPVQKKKKTLVCSDLVADLKEKDTLNPISTVWFECTRLTSMVHPTSVFG